LSVLKGGTTVAQHVIMDVLGRPFPDIMRELVLDPAGVKNNTFEQPLPPDRAMVAASGHIFRFWQKSWTAFSKL
jgi:CubicO group peptidase (beta-lactamase class C family)